jgi:cation:H+ antiporter
MWPTRSVLAVLAIPGLLAPGILEMGVLIRDYPVTLALTALLFVLAPNRGRGLSRLRRWEGGLLLALFSATLIHLGQTATA